MELVRQYGRGHDFFQLVLIGQQFLPANAKAILFLKKTHFVPIQINSQFITSPKLNHTDFVNVQENSILLLPIEVSSKTYQRTFLFLQAITFVTHCFLDNRILVYFERYLSSLNLEGSFFHEQS